MGIHWPEIVEAYRIAGSYALAGRTLGISRQRVHKAVKRHGEGKCKDTTPDYYHDTGCPDGSIPLCTECPLEHCKYE